MLKFWCMLWTGIFFAGLWLLLYAVVHFPFDNISFSLLVFVNLGTTTAGAAVRFLVGVNMALIWTYFMASCLVAKAPADIRKTSAMRK